MGLRTVVIFLLGFLSLGTLGVGLTDWKKRGDLDYTPFVDRVGESTSAVVIEVSDSLDVGAVTGNDKSMPLHLRVQLGIDQLAAADATSVLRENVLLFKEALPEGLTKDNARGTRVDVQSVWLPPPRGKQWILVGQRELWAEDWASDPRGSAFRLAGFVGLCFTVLLVVLTRRRRQISI